MKELVHRARFLWKELPKEDAKVKEISIEDPELKVMQV